MPEYNEKELDKYYNINNSGLAFSIQMYGKKFFFETKNRENKLLVKSGPFSSFEKAMSFAIRWINKTIWKIK